MDYDVESEARSALKFVRVALDDGYLTDISISMLLVELKRNGLDIVAAPYADDLCHKGE